MPFRKEKLKRHNPGAGQAACQAPCPCLPLLLHTRSSQISTALLLIRSENSSRRLFIYAWLFLTWAVPWSGSQPRPQGFPARLGTVLHLTAVSLRGRSCAEMLYHWTILCEGVNSGANCQGRWQTLSQGLSVKPNSIFVLCTNSDIPHCFLCSDKWLESHTQHMIHQLMWALVACVCINLMTVVMKYFI